MKLKLKRIGIDTHRESIAFLDNSDLLGRAIGLHPLDRVEVSANDQTVLAILYTVEGTILQEGTIGLSNMAFEKLSASEGAIVDVRPAEPPASADLLRAKMVGKETGERLSFDTEVVADKHSTGGVPGNRITPIVVSIAAAAGLVMPKTSSRSITSPAGTADTLEMLMNVELPPDRIYETVRKANACLAWGAALNLAPADDMFIQIEHPLRVDAEGLMLSCILAKKKAAGSTHVLLDIPFGTGTKAADEEEGMHLKERFQRLGSRLGLNVRVLLTDGSQPIGNGIGPVLEAKDVLKVLRNDPDAPDDLKRKSVYLAGELLELTGRCPSEGHELAEQLLRSGRAYEKFEAIREIQGRREIPPLGSLPQAVLQELFVRTS